MISICRRCPSYFLPYAEFHRFSLLLTGLSILFLGSFVLLHFVRFSLRRLSRTFFAVQIELLPNFDSPKHSPRRSFRPFFLQIPNCENANKKIETKNARPPFFSADVQNDQRWSGTSNRRRSRC
uniref:Uncharacterized protein n=1 Tax=Globodera rostochiensis TaxID=31243 RepID=A0A914H2L0_GLORO